MSRIEVRSSLKASSFLKPALGSADSQIESLDGSIQEVLGVKQNLTVQYDPARQRSQRAIILKSGSVDPSRHPTGLAPIRVMRERISKVEEDTEQVRQIQQITERRGRPSRCSMSPDHESVDCPTKDPGRCKSPKNNGIDKIKKSQKDPLGDVIPAKVAEKRAQNASKVKGQLVSIVSRSSGRAA